MFRSLVPVVVAGLVPFAVLTLIVLGTAFSLVAWEPPILQTTEFGTAGLNNGITALASDKTGLYAAGFVGYFFPGIGNLTSTYLFVNRYDLNGHQVWSQHFGGPVYPWIDISAGTDGVYVVGTQFFAANNQSSFVRRYDLSGNELWNNRFGNWSASSVSFSPTGLYVAGGNGTATIIKKFDLNGTLVWTRLASNISTYNSYVYSSPESVYVAGAGTVQKYEANGTSSWTGACSCLVTGITGDSSSVYIAGNVPSKSGLLRGYLARYSPSGNMLWTRDFSAPGLNSVNKVKIAADSSGVYLAETTGEPAGIVMNYDLNGNLIWSTRLPWATGLGYAPSDVIALGDSVLYVAGDFIDASSNGAFVTVLGKSSSLVFFGVNPPVSFGVLGALIMAVTACLLWLRWRWMKTRRPPRIDAKLHSQKIPSDISVSR